MRDSLPIFIFLIRFGILSIINQGAIHIQLFRNCNIYYHNNTGGPAV